MAALNVVCLISGGKDSLFSILHCLENGHNVVAIANLHPPEQNAQAVDDLDSYMYQTIGHAVVPLYEKALGLPLYRQEILGSAINQSTFYGPAGEGAEDETEALIPLLRKVKEHHPELNAVSTGAILSTYQRTRVESVAIRLGLTPLSFLWQYPSLPPFSQTSLLEDMAAVDQDSRIVKVASGGLDDNFLWQNVADPRTIHRLEIAVNRFGSDDDGAVLGEGGQYETLAVAGPPPLWKGRIEVDDDQREVIAGDAGSAILRIKEARVVADSERAQKGSKVRIPLLLEPRFQQILDILEKGRPRDNDITHDSSKVVKHASIDNEDTLESYSISDADRGLFKNITGEGNSVAEQARSIMDQITDRLRIGQRTFASVCYTSIILSDMTSFTTVNSIYGKYIEHPNPPARATLACSGVLPPGKHVMISVSTVSDSMLGTMRGLHVQSRSYWAPANIGPYSQAMSVNPGQNEGIKTDSLVYIAGQIPLIPASMELPVHGAKNSIQCFTYQAVLAMQHFVRISRVMHVRRWACGIAFITAGSKALARSRKDISIRAWEALHQRQTIGSPNDSEGSEDESFDVWHSQHGHAKSFFPQHSVASATPERALPPLRVVQVDALPRGSSIEWVMFGLTAEDGKRPRILHLEHLLKIFEGHVV